MLAVDVQNLNKVFRLYQKPIDRLKEALFRRRYHQEFKALGDISFQLFSGETLGIIGDNGAGKSTLLKILARTLTPTSGEITINGKVSALLELGAGFHSEFTGRQNIFLNASLQGLSEEDIQHREQQIIDFAELGEFIDRPIKTYSSGMIVRLAFSVATCVDPDILIVDEALSVGDHNFQQKCINRMIEFLDGGKTIILCSHSMYLINKLSRKTIWLDKGHMHSYDDTSRVISDYLAYQEEKGSRQATDEELRNVLEPVPAEKGSSTPDVIIEDIVVMNGDRKASNTIEQFHNISIRVYTKQINQPLRGHMVITLEMDGDRIVFGALSKEWTQEPITYSGQRVIELIIPDLPLQSGRYKVHAILSDEHALREVHEYSTPYYTVTSDHPEYGMIYMNHYWNML